MMFKIRLLCFFLLLINNVNCQIKCKYNVTTKITDGTRDGNVIIKNDVRYSYQNYYKDGNDIIGCPCEVKTCIRKCCPEDQAGVTDNFKCDYHKEPLNLELYNNDNFLKNKLVLDNYYLLDLNFCPKQKYMLFPDESADKFYVQEDGRLYLPNVKEDNYVLPIDYCVDTFKFNDSFMVSAKVCGELTKFPTGRIVLVVGK